MRRAGDKSDTHGDETDITRRLGEFARNVEIKARVDDLERTHRLVAQAADRGPELLTQTDIFFNVQEGRLKLREFSETEAELIFYTRPNAAGPKESRYKRLNVINPKEFKERLSHELGIYGQVHKKRWVYFVGRTRVHLDDVTELGPFLELEVILERDEPTESGLKEAEALMAKLEIHEDSLLSDAYIDLLKQKQA